MHPTGLIRDLVISATATALLALALHAVNGRELRILQSASGMGNSPSARNAGDCRAATSCPLTRRAVFNSAGSR